MDTVGPKDPRLRRRRCVQCVSAHVKCSGHLPCDKCIRRCQCCVYLPAQSGTILIENGRHFTPGDMFSSSTVAPLCVRKNTRYYDHFFDAFVPTNDFSSAASAWNQYLRASIGRDAMVATSITAVGALHAYQTEHSASKDESLLKRALNEYQEAVTMLRKTLSLGHRYVDLCPTISATFLLGLFESMYDETGDGWKRHMMYGIARLLDLSGPGAFHSAEVRSLYREIRLFEISRAILLSQSTALTQSSWLAFNDKLLTGCKSLHPKEAIFDMMLSCADLSQRYVASPGVQASIGLQSSARIRHYIDGPDGTMHEYAQQLQRFAANGFELRLQLFDLAKTLFKPQQAHHNNQQNILAQLYYFATSIYLSGVYDYHSIWQYHHISTPILSRPLIEDYVRRILEHSGTAIHNFNISHLLLLVPLRIAAARCSTQGQERQIEALFLKIQATFAVASAFLLEVRDLWARRQQPES